jgi:hypothetical protein
VWGYHTNPKVEEMINTCMLAQYTATGNTVGVAQNNSGGLTTKSVAIVAGKTPHSATEYITIQHLALPSLLLAALLLLLLPPDTKE